MALVTGETKEAFDRGYMEKKGVIGKEKSTDEQFERVKSHPKYAKLKLSLGKKGAMDAILKELNDKQC